MVTEVTGRRCRSLTFPIGSLRISKENWASSLSTLLAHQAKGFKRFFAGGGVVYILDRVEVANDTVHDFS